MSPAFTFVMNLTGVTIGTLSAELGRPATVQDVRDLDRRTAGRIYRAKYWDRIRGDDLPAGFDLVAFDGAINSGPARGAKWLQRGLAVPADGRIGPQTLAAANGAQNGVAVIEKACAVRLGFLQGLGSFRTFGKGWGRRVAKVEARAVSMWSGSRATLAAQERRATAARKQQQTNATAAGAGGGAAAGGGDLAGVPDVVVYGILAVAVVAAVYALLKAAHHARRRDAYRAELEA
ncbi:glycoside hydrolase family 108 protein [Sagittula salina]|uniref:Glycoside hydrolase family 108 protein n=1 Tax=Sagittula salina TaxID=2820268 RepID=A0A940MH57_9RHOB|nr:glycoside hydrolase family 108 protein [Sagittula salina]MBP0481645.1 glycoside hydrolase family 108 protein [Sagittula salina]